MSTTTSDTIDFGGGGTDLIFAGAGADTVAASGKRVDFEVVSLSGVTRPVGLNSAPYPYNNQVVRLTEAESNQFLVGLNSSGVEFIAVRGLSTAKSYLRLALQNPAPDT